MLVNLLPLLAVVSAAAPPFGLNLITNITTSGLSAGAFFALQYSVGFSGSSDGAAIFAGGPVYCSEGQLTTAETQCMSTGFLLNANTLAQDVIGFAQNGQIDPLNNLAHHKYFFYSGQSDYTVATDVVKAAAQQMQDLGVPSSQIATQWGIDSGHGVPTLKYGVDCDQTQSPYINNCQYDGVGAAFKQLFGSLNARTSGISGNIKQITTANFVPNGQSPDDISLGDTTYLYVPTACAGGAKCRLHIAFHGCNQGESFLGDVFYMNAGYQQWAESNNIVVMFPQAVADYTAENPIGCFDWWGYIGSDFAFKTGAQMATVHAMANYLGAQK